MTAREGGTGGRSRPGRRWAPAPVTAATTSGMVAAVVALTAVALALMGRPLIGAPGVPILFGPAGGPEGSQSLLDAYTLLHFVSGMALRVAIRPRTRHWPRGWLIAIAAASGMVWEVVENTPGLIERFGDSPAPHTTSATASSTPSATSSPPSPVSPSPNG